MNTQNWFYRACGIGIVSALPLFAAHASGLISHQDAHSATCSAFLPADATPIDSFHLCESDHGGKNTLYACQNFTSSHGHYRVFFKGGHYPKAIAMVTEKGEVNEMLWSETSQTDRPDCNLPPPRQIPATTKFMGAGVCKDEADQGVPCTVFRHRASRLKSISDYLVFYKIDGTGPEYTLSIDIGVNHDAAPAELAYQIGLNLLKTRCCQQRGLEYIAHAYQLFPDSTLYRATYQHFRQQVSNSALSSHLFVADGELE